MKTACHGLVILGRFPLVHSHSRNCFRFRSIQSLHSELNRQSELNGHSEYPFSSDWYLPDNLKEIEGLGLWFREFGTPAKMIWLFEWDSIKFFETGWFCKISNNNQTHKDGSQYIVFCMLVILCFLQCVRRKNG